MAETTQPADAEAAIQAEIDAIQQERAEHEKEMQRRQQKIYDDQRQQQSELGTAWTSGLREIDVRHRNATQRLGVARAERIKAEAIAALAPKRDVATPAATPNVE